MKRRSSFERLAVIWTPTVLVAIAAAMVLIDFWFGSQTFHIVGGTHVRDFSYDELYNLALHSAMLGAALAAALLFASLARRLVVGPDRAQPVSALHAADSVRARSL
jgi:hypothetical protein